MPGWGAECECIEVTLLTGRPFPGGGAGSVTEPQRRRHVRPGRADQALLATRAQRWQDGQDRDSGRLEEIIGIAQRPLYALDGDRRDDPQHEAEEAADQQVE